MDKQLSKQSIFFTARQPEWINYALGCIDADICPICGSDLLKPERDERKNEGELRWFECLNCDWQAFA